MSTEKWEQFWNNPSPTWRDRKHALYTRILDRVAGVAKERGPIRMLDVGCGPGIFLDRVRSLRGVNALGVDSSPTAQAICESHRLLVLRADVCEIPISGGGVDVITAIDVLEHLDRQHDALEHWRDLLSRGSSPGVLIVATPNGSDPDGKVSGLPPEKHYRRERLITDLQGAGFEKPSIEILSVASNEHILAVARPRS